jgi:hypothetical protein
MVKTVKEALDYLKEKRCLSGNILKYLTEDEIKHTSLLKSLEGLQESYDAVRHPLIRDWGLRGRLTPRAYFTIFLKAGDAENFGTFFAAIFIGLPV